MGFLNDDVLKFRQITEIVIAIVLCIIFTLYLAPSKEVVADQLVNVLLIIVLILFGFRWLDFKRLLLPLLPLLIMTFVMLIYKPSQVSGIATTNYAKELLIGILPFLLLYLVFRNQQPSQVQLWVIVIFFVPGVIHLGFMWIDIFHKLWLGDIPLLFSSKHGLLEHFKDVPRVGRRYLSQAIIHLLVGAMLSTWFLRGKKGRYYTWVFIGLAVLSLAILDARAAYASLFIGFVFLVLTFGRKVWGGLRSYFITSPKVMVFFVVLFAVAIAIGFNAGKSRWLAMHGSMTAAVHDVFYSEVELAQRPYVNAEFWDTPIEDIDECYLQQHFRCSIDQSAYLRSAWFLSGLQSLIQHPLGIGYSDDYMARLWGVSGEIGKYQRVDSFLVENIVSFGLPGILIYALLFLYVFYTLRRINIVSKNSVVLVAVGATIYICIGRAIVDSFNDGQWRYLMALLGIYCALLPSDSLKQGVEERASFKSSD